MIHDHAKFEEPPTVEELLAYERGDLSTEDAGRVQQSLVAWPELARAYATPFPPEDAELPDDVIERQWQAFCAEHRVTAVKGNVVRFWRGLSAVAAAVSILFGAMLWRAHDELLRPHVLPEPAILTPDGRRGLPDQPQYTIAPSGDALLLVVSLIGPTDYDLYRLDLVSAESQKRVWSSEPLRATNSNSFHVEIPSRTLSPGTYQVIAYGLRGNAQERVATYTIGVRRGGR